MIRYCKAYWDDVRQIISCIPNHEKLFGKVIMITGANGMICSSVVDILLHLNKEEDAGIQIVLAGRSSKKTASRFYEFAEGIDYRFMFYDAADYQNIDVNADFILHGAGNANPAKYTKEPVETMLANFIGLNNLLDMAVRMNSKRVLYISSSEVYGNITEIRPYKENDYGFVDILNMRASYPSAKRAAETLCVAYGSEYGLDTVMVRPGHIYGPAITDSDSRASAEFTRNAASGHDIVMKSKGIQLRSYCYSLDCASAILTVLLNGEKGNSYNISNKNSVCTISDIASAFANYVGRKVIFQDATAYDKKGYNLMINSSLDATKLEALGWKALFNLENGTARTIDYYV